MTFFLGWQREYQYFFVFASCFAVIFVTGHVRNYIEKRRVDRHLRQHGFLAETNPMTRAENIVSMGRDQLFGINQLLYGHYTDGVHVVHSSFSNTPVSSLPGSRSNSRPPSRDGKQMAGGEPGLGPTALRDGQLQPPNAERKVESYSPEPGPSSRTRGDSSQRPAVRSYAARKYTPSTPSRLSLALDSGDLGIVPSVTGRDDDSENRASSYSFRSVDDSDRSGSTRATSLDITRDENSAATRAGKDKVDLTSLSNHRMSHVAETGQFPRKKAPLLNTQAVERNRKAAYRALTTESEDDYDAVVPTKPKLITESDISKNPHDRSLTDAPGSSRPISATILNDFTPNDDIHVPLLEFTAPTPDGRRTTSDTTEPQAADSRRDSQFEPRRESESYRKVNANFEVSRSGKKLDITEALELGTLNLMSPIDLEEDNHNNKRQSRKLQKKQVSRMSAEQAADSTDKRRSSWLKSYQPNRRSNAL